MKRRLFLLLLAIAAGCGSDEGPPDGAPPGDLAGVDGAVGDLAMLDAALAPVRFVIQFDYRFDTQGFFSDPARRACLEETAKLWGRLIQSDFPTVPAGTALKVRDPEHPSDAAVDLVAPADIDNLIVFVGSAAIDGPQGSLAQSNHTGGVSTISDATLQAALYARYHGSPFQPWVAWISFDPAEAWTFDADPATTEPVPAGKLDFVSVALHELAHVLGQGTADVWESQVSAQTFTGPKATAVFGAPIPLTADGVHVAPGTTYMGETILAVSAKTHDRRYLPTAVDRALLEDLGYAF
jgi:hypothetical protein